MAKSYIGVIRAFEAAPDGVRDYFPNFVELVREYPWEVSVSYVHSRIEQAKRMTIYCGIVKRHWCDSRLTWQLVSEDHMQRARFKNLFNVVFGEKIPDELVAKLERGEKVRDKIAHGQGWQAKEARLGLCSTFEFAAGFNDFVRKRTQIVDR